MVGMYPTVSGEPFMSTERKSYILLDVPERGLRDYRAMVEDITDLGWKIELHELFDMGSFAVTSCGRHYERIPEITRRIYNSSEDFFSPNIDPELIYEVILLATETSYCDLVSTYTRLGLVNSRVWVVGADDSGILLEV
jgi:hypothetical protein